MARLGQTKAPFSPAPAAVACRDTWTEVHSDAWYLFQLTALCSSVTSWDRCAVLLVYGLNLSSVDLASSCMSPRKPLASTDFWSSVTQLAGKHLVLFVLDLLHAHFSWFPLVLLLCETWNRYSLVPLSTLLVVSRVVQPSLCSFCSTLKSPKRFNHSLCRSCVSLLTLLWTFSCSF